MPIAQPAARTASQRAGSKGASGDVGRDQLQHPELVEVPRLGLARFLGAGIMKTTRSINPGRSIQCHLQAKGKDGTRIRRFSARNG
jgi:hypothetical protein